MSLRSPAAPSRDRRDALEAARPKESLKILDVLAAAIEPKDVTPRSDTGTTLITGCLWLLDTGPTSDRS